jgi:hypothetical protein
MPAVPSTLEGACDAVLRELIGQGRNGELKGSSNEAINDDSVGFSRPVEDWTVVAVV